MEMWLCRRSLKKYIFLTAVLVLGIVLFRSRHTEETRQEKSRPRQEHPSLPHAHPTQPVPAQVWCVVVTDQDPNDRCISLAGSLPEWIILLVGVKTPSPYSHSRCRFLDNNELTKIITKYDLGSLPDANVSLIAGYVYALQNHAEWIYASPDNFRTDRIPPFSLQKQYKEGLVFSDRSQNFFDNNIHFGCNASSISGKDYSEKYSLCEFKTPLIQASASIGPLRKVDAKSIDVSLQQDTITYCDATSPNVCLDSNVFTLFEMQDAVYHRDAFWALPFVATKHVQRTSYVKWRLICQKLLWLSGNYLLITYNGPNNSTTSDELYVASEFSQQLSEASCLGSDLLECLLKFVQDYIGDQNWYNMYSYWVKILKDKQYKFSHIISNPLSRECHSPVSFHPVKYSIPLTTTEWRRKPFVPVPNVKTMSTVLHQTCDNSWAAFSEIDLARPWIQYANSLLLIVFNDIHYEVIPYLEVLYRTFFPHILYCGPLILSDKANIPFSKDLEISFVTYKYTSLHVKGALNYECVRLANQMGYNVNGYLVIADDVLLATHPLEALFQKYPQNVWYLPEKEIRIGEILKLRECRLGMCDFYPHWLWWEEYRPKVIELFYEVHQLQWQDPTISKCYKELVRLNGADLRPNGGFADVYYIPQRLISTFSHLSALFLKHEVFLEIAVPTILRCLELPDDIQPLHGEQLWMEDRVQPWKYFTRKHISTKNYLHPTKWSNLTHSSANVTEFYCHKVLPFMHDRFGRFPQ